MTSHPAATAIPATSGVASPPRLGTGPVGIAVRCVVAPILLFGGLLLSQVPVALAPPLRGLVTRADTVGILALAGIQVVSGLVVTALLWLWVRFVERRTLAAVGWRITRSSGLWLVLGMAVSAVVVTTASFVPSPGITATGSLAEAAGQSSIPLWTLLVLLLTQAFALQGIPEELIFRGWLLDTVRRRGPWLGLVLSTVAFAVPHLLSNGGQQNLADRVMYLAVPFGFGLCGATLVYVTGSLWSAIGVHGGFHVANAVTIAATGVAPGPAGWLAVGACYVVAAAIALVVWQRRTNGN